MNDLTLYGLLVVCGLIGLYLNVEHAGWVLAAGLFLVWAKP